MMPRQFDSHVPEVGESSSSDLAQSFVKHRVQVGKKVVEDVHHVSSDAILHSHLHLGVEERRVDRVNRRSLTCRQVWLGGFRYLTTGQRISHTRREQLTSQEPSLIISLPIVDDMEPRPLAVLVETGDARRADSTTA